MAKIQSQEVRKAYDALRISQTNEKLITETEDKVQLTFDISPCNPDKNNQIIKSQTATATNATTVIYTTDNVQDKVFYLTSVQLSYTQSSLGNAAEIRIEANPIGESAHVHLLSVKMDTTAGIKEKEASLVFQRPLALKPNTTIRFGNDCTAGTVAQRGNITGYYA